MTYRTIIPKGGDTGTPLSLQKRIAFFSKHNIPLANQRVIDCGCGTGQYVVELLKQGADAYGVEYDAGKVAAYQKKHPDMAERISQGDIERTAYPSETFDLALLNEVLEHVPNDQKGLCEVFRLLKPGGHLVVFSPNRFFPFESHGVYWKNTKKRLPVYIPFIPWIPMDLGEQLFSYWARNYWPWELQRLVQSAGFQILHIDFLWQTFENISKHQPFAIQLLRTPLRFMATTLERIPLVKAFGVSQVLLARKPLTHTKAT